MNSTYAEQTDVLFLVDGSRSMNERLKTAGMRKMEIVKKGLKAFILENWPISYYPYPLRIGLVFYRLLGTPGKTDLQEVIPLNPPPPSLELFRLEELEPKGGSPLVDAVRYGLSVVSDSTRPNRKMKVVSDGGNDGESVEACIEEVKNSGVRVDAIELSNTATSELRELATAGRGLYLRPTNLATFLDAVKS